MVKRVKWVCELPIKVQKSVMKDIYMICENNGMTADDIRDNIEYVMREKLINLMNDDTDLISLIKEDIIAFDAVSRFPDFGLSENIQKAIGMDVQNPGVKVSEDDGDLTINCEIIVYFGVNIPQLCYDIQSKVKRDIEERNLRIIS